MEFEQKQQSPTWMGCAEGAWVGMGIGMGAVGAGDVQSGGILWDVLLFLPRICYTDTSSPQEDQYPPNIAVKVNHSYCSVPVRLGRETWGRSGESGRKWLCHVIEVHCLV